MEFQINHKLMFRTHIKVTIQQDSNLRNKTKVMEAQTIAEVMILPMEQVECIMQTKTPLKSLVWTANFSSLRRNNQMKVQ